MPESPRNHEEALSRGRGLPQEEGPSPLSPPHAPHRTPPLTAQLVRPQPAGLLIAVPRRSKLPLTSGSGASMCSGCLDIEAKNSVSKTSHRCPPPAAPPPPAPSSPAPRHNSAGAPPCRTTPHNSAAAPPHLHCSSTRSTNSQRCLTAACFARLSRHSASQQRGAATTPVYLVYLDARLTHSVAAVCASVGASAVCVCRLFEEKASCLSRWFPKRCSEPYSSGCGAACCHTVCCHCVLPLCATTLCATTLCATALCVLPRVCAAALYVLPRPATIDKGTVH